MADRVTPEQRSKTMARVKSKNTGPELTVRSLLHAMGYRFRLHRTDLPGKPDIVLPRHRKVIFVHGCFWHGHSGCRRSARPSSNRAFWDKKIDRNIERDAHAIAALQEAEWQVLVVWECQMRDKEALTILLTDFMSITEPEETGIDLGGTGMSLEIGKMNGESGQSGLDKGQNSVAE